MAASTIIPSEMAKPPKDIRFADRPTCCMMMNVANVARGKVRATTSAPRRFLKNRYKTSITTAAPSNRARSTVVKRSSHQFNAVIERRQRDTGRQYPVDQLDLFFHSPRQFPGYCHRGA